MLVICWRGENTLQDQFKNLITEYGLPNRVHALKQLLAEMETVFLDVFSNCAVI